MKPTTPIIEAYWQQKDILLKQIEEQRAAILKAFAQIGEAAPKLEDLESQRYSLQDAFMKQMAEAQTPTADAPGAEPWHPASEKPERTEGWFLAVSKDGNPFLTHFIGAEKYFVNNVHMWQYVNLPI